MITSSQPMRGRSDEKEIGALYDRVTQKRQGLWYQMGHQRSCQHMRTLWKTNHAPVTVNPKPMKSIMAPGVDRAKRFEIQLKVSKRGDFRIDWVSFKRSAVVREQLAAISQMKQ